VQFRSGELEEGQWEHRMPGRSQAPVPVHTRLTAHFMPPCFSSLRCSRIFFFSRPWPELGLADVEIAISRTIQHKHNLARMRPKLASGVTEPFRLGLSLGAQAPSVHTINQQEARINEYITNLQQVRNQRVQQLTTGQQSIDSAYAEDQSICQWAEYLAFLTFVALLPCSFVFFMAFLSMS
jgi:hypothetical protein